MKLYSIVSDITAVKEAEEMARNSEKLAVIGELAAGVAHEIRNPLTALKGFVRLIPEANEEARDRYTQIMKNELSRIEGIVSEMLILAKPQAIQYRPTNINESVVEVANLLAPQANMHSVDVQVQTSDAKRRLFGHSSDVR